MADDAEDVLELDGELELDVLDEEDGEPEGETEQTDGEVAEDDGEDDIGFGDEGAAPAQESSVIRDLRKRERELVRAKRELERKLAEHERPQINDPGPEPQLDEFGYDEDQWKPAWLEWREKVEVAAKARAEIEQAEEAKRKSWEETVASYQTRKSEIRVSNFEEAEDMVSSALPDQTMAALISSGKGPELVVALHRNPQLLEELSKKSLFEAAMMIGELRGKLQVKPRSTITPERRVSGNAGFAGGTDKKLARLEKEAERTGDRTELIRYRKQLQARAKT